MVKFIKAINGDVHCPCWILTLVQEILERRKLCLDFLGTVTRKTTKLLTILLNLLIILYISLLDRYKIPLEWLN